MYAQLRQCTQMVNKDITQFKQLICKSNKTNFLEQHCPTKCQKYTIFVLRFCIKTQIYQSSFLI